MNANMVQRMMVSKDQNLPVQNRLEAPFINGTQEVLHGMCISNLGVLIILKFIFLILSYKVLVHGPQIERHAHP